MGGLLGNMVVSITYMLGVVTMCRRSVTNLMVVELFFLGCMGGEAFLGSLVVIIHFMQGEATMHNISVALLRVVVVIFKWYLGSGACKGGLLDNILW